MDLIDVTLVFILSLCWWTAAGRSTWSETPGLIVSSSEIEDGETVEVTCTLPIDYTGGECRLYRDDSETPFTQKTTSDYLCVFHLTSKQLLGTHPVGSRIYLKCNYHLQAYTSVFSDIKGVTVWRSSPSPSLYVSHRFVSPNDSVEVECSPPLCATPSCSFYRDEDLIASGSCSRNLTGKQLTIWEKSTVLLPVKLTCRYFLGKRINVRSEPSDHHLLFVVDATQVSSSVRCNVLVEDDQLAAFGGSSWKFANADGPTVTVHVTNSSVTHVTCNKTPD